jgi:hypothetical protein
MTWEYLYKIDYKDSSVCSTNLLYAPLLNKEKTVLCMDFADIVYHKTPLSTRIREYFFDREVSGLKAFSNYEWCPRLLDIQGKKIFIDLGTEETLNRIVMDKSRSLDRECIDWKDQIRTIISDVRQAEYYKVTLYPHCFAINKFNSIQTIDFYGCVSVADRMMPLEFIREMIGKDSVDRFAEATVDNNIDFEIFYNRLLTHHLFKYWPELF